MLHTSREYEAELREVRAHLVAMGARCERALTLAVTMFVERDASQMDEIAQFDAKIDRDEIEIDELVLRILALRQPVAYDLRFWEHLPRMFHIPAAIGWYKDKPGHIDVRCGRITRGRDEQNPTRNRRQGNRHVHQKD